MSTFPSRQSNRKHWRFTVAFGFVAALLFLSTPQVFAESSDGYAAALTGRSHGSVRLRPGQAATVWVELQNTGTRAWQKKGSEAVVLGLDRSRTQASALRHAFWPAAQRVAKLQALQVLPGERTRIAFAVQAPLVPGTYNEYFQLVAGSTPVPGGSLHVPLTVIGPYEATVSGQAFGTMHLQPGQAATLWVDFRNTGTATWKNSGAHFVALNATDPAGRLSAFRHAYWPLSYRPARLTNTSVAPGDVGRVRFALQAPMVPGTYLETFQLVAEHLTWIPGSRITIPIVVDSPAPTGPEGPLISVGLRAVAEPMVIRANTSMNLLRDSISVTSVPVGSTITLAYLNGTYTATTPQGSFDAATPLVVAPGELAGFLEAVNFENRPGWNPELNDNTFRGSLRLRFAPQSGALWLINEVPLELYLRGIAEASNDAPMEYAKALMTAARSYAHSHIRTATKHADEGFIVDATNDQVYRGYGFELRAPRITEAVQATAGLEVTYNGTPVITPYFSQSDGRTRSWQEVWSGGPYPWLVSVDDPACAGKTLLGHGVGLSATGALSMANADATFQQILGYYYSGTALTTQYSL